jgi:hypothetical protein
MSDKLQFVDSLVAQIGSELVREADLSIEPGA